MIKFNFGNKKPKIFKYAIVGVILSSTIGLLSQCTKIDEKSYWDLYDEIQRRVSPKSMTNDFILSDPKKLERRIHRDVNQAIESVTPEYDRIIQKETQKYLPRYIEEKNNDEVCYTKACKSLGGPMRMCSPYYSGCPSGTEGLTEKGI
jgi:hypothetical protein